METYTCIHADIYTCANAWRSGSAYLSLRKIKLSLHYFLLVMISVSICTFASTPFLHRSISFSLALIPYFSPSIIFFNSGTCFCSPPPSTSPAERSFIHHLPVHLSRARFLTCKRHSNRFEGSLAMTAVFLWTSAGENKWQDENKDQSKSATLKTRNTK